MTQIAVIDDAMGIVHACSALRDELNAHDDFKLVESCSKIIKYESSAEVNQRVRELSTCLPYDCDLILVLDLGLFAVGTGAREREQFAGEIEELLVGAGNVSASTEGVWLGMQAIKCAKKNLFIYLTTTANEDEDVESLLSRYASNCYKADKVFVQRSVSGYRPSKFTEDYAKRPVAKNFWVDVLRLYNSRFNQGISRFISKYFDITAGSSEEKHEKVQNDSSYRKQIIDDLIGSHGEAAVANYHLMIPNEVQMEVCKELIGGGRVKVSVATAAMIALAAYFHSSSSDDQKKWGAVFAGLFTLQKNGRSITPGIRDGETCSAILNALYGMFYALFYSGENSGSNLTAVSIGEEMLEFTVAINCQTAREGRTPIATSVVEWRDNILSGMPGEPNTSTGKITFRRILEFWLAVSIGVPYSTDASGIFGGARQLRFNIVPYSSGCKVVFSK